MSTSHLEIRDLCAGYGSRVVIEKVSMTLSPGEWFVLIGPNGCGKSTLLDCVANRRRPTSGDIFIAGHSLKKNSFDAKRHLGYGCAPEILPGLLTARQCLEIHAGAKGLASINDDLFKLADDLQFAPYLNSFVDTLSLGTKQKLSILLALIGDPLLIVLDEAFNGLDPRSSLILKRHLRERLIRYGATLLLATHSLDVVEHYADRAGLLVDGKMDRMWSTDDLRGLRKSGQRFDEALASTITA